MQDEKYRQYTMAHEVFLFFKYVCTPKDGVKFWTGVPGNFEWWLREGKVRSSVSLGLTSFTITQEILDDAKRWHASVK
jgi:hypothetical protein